MDNHTRKQDILNLLSTRQKLTVDELLAEIPASPATLRRDFKVLEKQGAVIRVHGGIVHPEAFRGESPYDYRLSQAQEAKAEMAELAASIIPADSNIFIDAGTTFIELGHRLFSREDITIYTNSLSLAFALHTQNVRVICIGGEVKVVSKALVGGIADQWLGHLTFDIAFIGTSGLSESEGAYATSIDEAHVKQLAMKRAERKILMADSSKWNQPEAVLFGQWSQFNDWICDAGLSGIHAKSVRKQGVNVIQKEL
jgi:DeoR/GlpR family transcriptional regulator of sugar metabolism